MKKLEFDVKQVLIVLLIIILILNGIKMIKKQKNTTISINAVATDNYGYAKKEELKLEAKETVQDDTTSPIVTINGTKVSGGDSTSGKAVDINPKEDYGKYVNYASSTYSNSDLSIEGWQLLYADDTNIYLIADNYIKNNYVPAGKGGNKSNNGSTTYGVFLYEQSRYYMMNIKDINETVREKLLSKYIASPSNLEYTFWGAKATAYLLDIDAWSGFKDDKFADWAVGGPSLEILLESYNAQYGVDGEHYMKVDNYDSYGFEYQISSNLTYQDVNFVGYQTRGGANRKTITSDFPYQEYLQTGMQFLAYDSSKPMYYYIASPVGYSSGSEQLYMAGSSSYGNIGTLIKGTITPTDGALYTRYPPCNLYK